MLEHSKYSSLPDWAYTAFQPPNITKEFDLSPITSSIIKRLLKRYKKPSAPGMDKITYGQLRNLPTCHHFLATLYTKIMRESMEAPSQWGQGEIILIHKKSDQSTPSNYRPIILSSTISKLFHKILALRMERFCLANKIINPSIQKDFLSGVNGTMEHIFTLTSVIIMPEKMTYHSLSLLLILRMCLGQFPTLL